MKKFRAGFITLLFSIVFLVSCTKTGTLTGGTSSGSFSSSVNGSVSGGLSPISGATVSLFVAGKNSALGSATTTSSGTFTIAYNNPGTSTSALYLLVTGGSAGSGTNSNLQLGAFLGAGNSTPKSVVINEASTIGFFEAMSAYGMTSDTNGTVTFNAPKNQAAMNNMAAQYNNFITNGFFNTSLSATNTTTFGTMANNVASCVEVSSSCASFFNNTLTTSSGASINILDAINNMMNGSPSIANLFTTAQSLSGTTGFTVTTQPSLLNVLPVVAANTFPVGGSTPNGIAIDGAGNAWVGVQTANNVVELSSSGSILGTFTVGTGPRGVVIDSAGNVWVANFNTNNVTELNSSGTTLGTFSVGTHPYVMAIDGSGNIWVTNFDGNNVTELNSSGSTLGTFSTGTNPRGMAIDASGNVWIGNNGSANLTELNSSGNTLNTISLGTGNPVGVTIDPSGNVWLAIGNNKVVSKLNTSGTTLGSFSTGSTGPFCLAFDASGALWDGNITGGLVQKFNSSGTTLGNLSVGPNPVDIAIDASGNIWTTNNGSTSVTQLPGVAAGPEFFPYSGPIFVHSGF